LWAAVLLFTPIAFGQPFGRSLTFEGYPVHGYIEIADDATLETPAMTVEAWVSVRDARSNNGCSSIAGKGYINSWWLGLCGTSMRSYFNGVVSVKTGGLIPPDSWVHIATVTDGAIRRHYINGELVLEAAESPQMAGTKPLRIGSDPDWDYTPEGSIDELRIWKVARTQEQIRSTMFASFVTETNDTAGRFTGLEAWYRFEGNALDSWHNHHGSITGTGITFSGDTLSKRRSAKH
jgi:hypothetical protein